MLQIFLTWLIAYEIRLDGFDLGERIWILACRAKSRLLRVAAKG